MAVWVPFTLATKRAVQTGKAATGAAARRGAAVGRKLTEAGVDGTRRAGQAGRRRATAGVRGAGSAGRRGVQKAGRGARGAAQAGRAGKGAQAGLPGSKARDAAKGGWARQALRDASGGRGGGAGLPGGRRGRGRGGSEDANQSTPDATTTPEDAGRDLLRNRFRRRRGPLNRTRRRARRIVIVALAAVAMVPLMAGLYGAEASTEAEQAQMLMQMAAGCGAPPDVIAERIADELPAALSIPTEAIAAYCSAAGAFEHVDWTILAGIGKAECDHGRSQLPGCPRDTVNPCGARGPMQFLGNTWRSGTDPVPSGECPGSSEFTGNSVGPPIPDGQESAGFATDGDGDRVADPWEWFDATHAAARHLLHNGLEDDPRRALRAYNDSDEYVEAVLETAEEYRRVTADLVRPGPDALVAGCPPDMRRGGSAPITITHNTEATRVMANAVIDCFGRSHGVGCYAEREGDRFEHPRGRACDFMATSGGRAGGEEAAWGQAMAEWVAANAEDLKVLYVIWYDRSWNPSDGDIPWEEWGDYSGCSNPCTDPYTGHHNHVHVSIELQPGDPPWARCTHDACTD
ncbi:MAG: lytic transglycosylase domain-containing protein [Acidimicrobiales bacterium]